MKSSLLAALAAFAIPSCERNSPTIELPSSSSSTLASSSTFPCRSEVVINIDQHERRIILEQHYDSDSALKNELARRFAVSPSLAAVIRADRRVRNDAVARALLLTREAGISDIYLAFRRPDSPREETYLRIRN